MNQSAVISADPVLKMFDADASKVLGEMAGWLGLDGISMQMEPSFVRHKIAVACEHSFANEFYSTVHRGKAEFPDAPALKQAYVNDHVKSEADKRFKALVSVDNMRREVLGGRLWEPSRVVCDEILATSYEDCTGCHNGTVTCGGCSGHGTQICNNCRITGHPAGYVTCWGCHGTGGGRDAGTQEWCNCSVCNGWKRKLCRTCDGSTKVRCSGCGGDGTVYCGSCGGHGYFTRAHGYRVSLELKAHVRSATLSEADGKYFVAWLKQGLPGRTSQEAGTVMPCAMIDSPDSRYDGWKDGVFTALLGFTCNVTTATVKASYAGKQTEFLYGRYGTPAFGFANFLDHVVDDVLKVVVEKEDMPPSQYLATFSKVPGLAAGMRLAGSSKEGKSRFMDESSDVLRGSVHSELIDIAVDGYLASVGVMERDVSGRVGRDVSLAVAAAWIACWLGGVFEYVDGLGNDYRLLACVGLALGVSSISAALVKALTRRRISSETGAAAKYGLRGRGKLLCFLGGVAFAFAGMLSATYGG
jgi:hypothetical protein